MSEGDSKKQDEIRALKVHQWLHEWEKVKFPPEEYRRRPAPFFYLFQMRAPELKALTGIYRRTTEGGRLRSADLGIQRGHDEERSEEIRLFAKYGYPWSEMSSQKRESRKFEDLRKPGWLPTAIVVNILTDADDREGRRVSRKDLVTIEESSNEEVLIKLPQGFDGPKWRPSGLYPLEVIDGQHRLWAFEDETFEGRFELPVVAFQGLDRSWQAYLFWTINIKPKKINASLAFDLYPLLRMEDWLEQVDPHHVYRETRAQELTETLWAHPDSPWYHRIEMLGERRAKYVSQAAWIRSLLATYVKRAEGGPTKIGGLFGALVGNERAILTWGRVQQAAFLIVVWTRVAQALGDSKQKWAEALRALGPDPEYEDENDLAFSGPHTLINTDQGVRGVLYITNDLCFLNATELKLLDWRLPREKGEFSQAEVTNGVRSMSNLPVFNFLSSVAQALTRFDWRTSDTPDLTRQEQVAKLVFRGSSGYKEIRRQLLECVAEAAGLAGKTAVKAMKELGY